MVHPLLYEINTRCWLRELSLAHGAPVTLADVPESEFAGWQRRGFTHLWLMGVWTTGPRARAAAFRHTDLLNAYNQLLPGWRDEDIAGSPYAIAEYQVPPALGGDAALRKFRERLHAHGLKLILDFVPNHLGLDHPWVAAHPERLVQSPAQVPGTFHAQTTAGPRWIAHGKDPNYAPWDDTVQLDYRRADTRAAVTALLQSIADRCDGVRCDMAMLLLNDVIARTWSHLPAQPGSPAATGEFWPAAIAAVKRARPEFLFLAEVYWSLEGRLQSLGFDYTYDKHLFDLLVSQSTSQVQPFLLGCPPSYVAASAHFLENHDEDPIAPRLNSAQHLAAALAILGLPGMRFLHEGQLTGATQHIPVQLARRPAHKTDPAITALYENLLATIQKSAVGRGDWKLLRPREAWGGNPTAGNFLLVRWQQRPGEFDLVAINLAPHRSQCYAHLEVPDLAARDWKLTDRLGGESHERFGDDLAQQGLYLDTPAHAAQLFHFEPK